MVWISAFLPLYRILRRDTLCAIVRIEGPCLQHWILKTFVTHNDHVFVRNYSSDGGKSLPCASIYLSFDRWSFGFYRSGLRFPNCFCLLNIASGVYKYRCNRTTPPHLFVFWIGRVLPTTTSRSTTPPRPAASRRGRSCPSPRPAKKPFRLRFGRPGPRGPGPPTSGQTQRPTTRTRPRC